MKKYTIQEIDEIRAKALFDFEQANNDSPDWENFANKEDYIHITEAIRKADEKAGILIITDEKEVKNGDLVKSIHKQFKYEPSFWLYKYYHCEDDKNWKHKLIQRNKTPVYQCKKRGRK